MSRPAERKSAHRKGAARSEFGEIRRRLEDQLSADREAMLAFARDLISIPTENPPGRACLPCVKRIREELRRLGFPSELIPVPGGAIPGSPGTEGPGPPGERRHCLRSRFGSGRKVLYFHGHYDVVPAFDPEQFRPRIAKGFIHGRGSADMKGGLASMVYAVRALQATGIRPAGRIEMVFVPDEETGGRFGSGHLWKVRKPERGAVAMLTPEPSGGIVWNACRGAVSLRVTVRGRPAHVGLHHRGVNAFERTLPLIRDLLRLKAEVGVRRTRFPIRPAAARMSVLLLGGRSEGGVNFNTVPGEFSFTVDRRFNPEERLETERSRLLALLDRFRRKGLVLDSELLQEGASAGTPKSHPAARALARSIEEVTGRRARFELCPGLLETRFYASRDVPSFAYGPGLLSVSHGPKEFVRVEEMARCAAVYALAALRLLGSATDTGRSV